jgi:hypothetical protein
MNSSAVTGIRTTHIIKKMMMRGLTNINIVVFKKLHTLNFKLLFICIRDVNEKITNTDIQTYLAQECTHLASMMSLVIEEMSQ